MIHSEEKAKTLPQKKRIEKVISKWVTVERIGVLFLNYILVDELTKDVY
jgi:hypothetical protein